MSKRRILGAAAAVVTVGLAVAAGVVSTHMWPRELGLNDVAGLVPADTASIDATDWTAVREALDVPADRVLAEAGSRDLAARSVLASSGENVSDTLRWRPSTVRWEAWVQAPVGSALFVGLPGSLAQARKALADGGWVDQDGVWVNDSTAGSTPAHLSHVRLLDGGVAVSADSPEVLAAFAQVEDGERTSLADDHDGAAAWATTTRLAVFALQRSDAGCVSTSPAAAGEDIAAQAEVAIEKAGDLEKYQWLVRGLDPASEEFRVAMAFDSAGVAAEQAVVRSRLATGPLIGHEGRVEDSIVLERTAVDGGLAVLDFDHLDTRRATLMSFIGPLVLASC